MEGDDRIPMEVTKECLEREENDHQGFLRKEKDFFQAKKIRDTFRWRTRHVQKQRQKRNGLVRPLAGCKAPSTSSAPVSLQPMLGGLTSHLSPPTSGDLHCTISHTSCPLCYILSHSPKPLFHASNISSPVFS